MHWEEGNNQSFRELLDKGSKLTTLVKHPKCQPDSPISVGHLLFIQKAASFEWGPKQERALQ